MPLIPVVRVAVEKTVRAFSDGSGALPRAMMLPHGTNRESVTSFPAMLVTLGAMALVAAGGGNYVKNDVKEHHGKLASISLDGTALMEKINYMGFGGRNSTWSSDFKEVTTTRGSMALGCKALNGQKGMKRMVSSGFEALKRVKREKVMYLYAEFESPWLVNVTKMA